MVALVSRKAQINKSSIALPSHHKAKYRQVSVASEFQTRRQGPLESEGRSEEWEKRRRDLIESTRSSGELRLLPMYIIYVSLRGMWEMSEMWNPVTSGSHEVRGYMGVDGKY